MHEAVKNMKTCQNRTNESGIWNLESSKLKKVFNAGKHELTQKIKISKTHTSTRLEQRQWRLCHSRSPPQKPKQSKQQT
jgi:hypothetical protein